MKLLIKSVVATLVNLNKLTIINDIIINFVNDSLISLFFIS